MTSGEVVFNTPGTAALVFSVVFGPMPSKPAEAYAPGPVHFAQRTAGSVQAVALPDSPRWKRGPSTHYRQRKYGPRSGWRAASQRYATLVEQASNQYGVEAALIHAVIRVESGYEAKAVSPKGAAGLMQLMPRTARRYGVRDRFDPGQNIDGGVRYLRDLLTRFKYPHLALAAYNAGENAVNRNGNVVPPYTETQAYVKRVMRFYLLLKQSTLR